MIKIIFEGFRRICTIDLRSLALLRIGIALTLLIDLIIRIFNLQAHYTDQGILPLEALFRYAWNGYYYSLYTMCTTWQLQAAIFGLNASCILLLLFGYKTRLFTFLCWVFMLSIHNRNPLIHQGGDDLLRLILFWGLFLPWGYYYSVDAANMVKEPNQIKPRAYTSIIVLAYILQIMYVYLFSALLKTSPEWWGEFSALYYALSFDQIVLPLGKLIYPYYDLLRVGTAVTYCIELLLPFVLLIPVHTNFFRMLFIFVVTILHVGITLTLNVGIFPLIAVIAMIGLLPGNIFDKIAALPEIRNFARSFTFDIKTRLQRNYYVPKEHFIITNLILFFIFYTLSWNIGTTGRPNLLSSGKMEWIGHLFRVDQHWGMFAPAVFKDDGWFIFAAIDKTGKEIDIMNNGQKISEKRTAQNHKLFHSDRWRKYAENFLLVIHGHYRPYFCFYLMDRWNEKREGKEQIRKLDIYYIKQASLPGYKVQKAKKELLCNCEKHE